ncbi:MAG: glycerol-3-phosphate dehydrogenase C-terminal domain-containing protein [Thermoleophilaceae bacterium]
MDAAVRGLDQKVPPSVTETTPLLGAEGYHVLFNQRTRLARQSGLHVERIEHLLGRYGAAVHDLLAEIADDRALGEPLEGADDYLRAEVRYAASHEGALHLDDVLARRTRISTETFDRGLTAAEPAARLMGEVLGWTDERRAARGRPLPPARGRRARVADQARRPGGRRGAHVGARLPQRRPVGLTILQKPRRVRALRAAVPSPTVSGRPRAHTLEP